VVVKTFKYLDTRKKDSRIILVGMKLNDLLFTSLSVLPTPGKTFLPDQQTIRQLYGEKTVTHKNTHRG
jgi:hypothetical protein